MRNLRRTDKGRRHGVLGHYASDDPLGFLDGVDNDLACRSDVVDQTDALASERHVVLSTAGQNLIEDYGRQRRRTFGQLIRPVNSLFGENFQELSPRNLSRHPTQDRTS